jgi:hypothetical protein
LSFNRFIDFVTDDFLLPQTCQRDIKRLRERELTLQGDLAAAGKEILRLRGLVKDFNAQPMSDL